MNLMRHPVRLALLATALCVPSWTARAQDAVLSIPDSEASDPPTQERLAQVESVASASSWLSAAPALRSAAFRAYGRGRLAAADAWFHAYEWSVLFSEPEDRFIGGWINAMVAAKLNYPGVAGE